MPPESWSGNWFSTSCSPTSSRSSRARRVRSSFAIPRISSPNATLSITRRCARSPKCWNTIETEWRRSSRSSPALAAVTSCSAIRIVPAVGSISRISVRTSVDFPEPDRPMTTNTSPRQTSNETSRTAAIQPVFSRNSCRESSASGVPRMRSALGPKIFQMPEAAMSGSPARPLPVTRLIYQSRRFRARSRDRLAASSGAATELSTQGGPDILAQRAVPLSVGAGTTPACRARLLFLCG